MANYSFSPALKHAFEQIYGPPLEVRQGDGVAKFFEWNFELRHTGTILIISMRIRTNDLAFPLFALVILADVLLTIMAFLGAATPF